MNDFLERLFRQKLFWVLGVLLVFLALLAPFVLRFWTKTDENWLVQLEALESNWDFMSYIPPESNQEESWGDFLKNFENSLESLKSAPLSTFDRQRWQLIAGLYALRQGKTEEGQKLLSSMNHYSYPASLAEWTLARSYEKAGDLESAERAYANLTKSSTLYFRVLALFHQARLREELGRHQGAVELYEKLAQDYAFLPWGQMARTKVLYLQLRKTKNPELAS